MSQLTPEERAHLVSSGIFSNRPEGLCTDCGGYHLRACPRIKRLVLLGNGNRTEVEYWAQWDESNTIYPEDVYDDSEEQHDD
jgi:hypothetical protein